jgi:hypothetical protein
LLGLGGILLDLLPFWAIFPIVGSVPISLWFWDTEGGFAIVGTTVVCFSFLPILCFHLWRNRWLWRFLRRTWRFQTLANKRLVLRFAPELQGHSHLSRILEIGERCLADQEQQFGFSLRRRLAIYLFPHWEEISQVFRRKLGGIALTPGSAVVIPAGPGVEEALRHELAHLFAARWNLWSTPLISEGLATWTQKTVNGVPIDKYALSLLRARQLRLSALLRRSFFYAPEHCHSCYVLAGSFTGFLIRRFGWKNYRRFYRRSNAVSFKKHFRKHFGSSLEKAEWSWRNELLVLPILRARIGQ